jgi:hypothetical protein
LQPPGHHRREHCERQRKDGVAETYEFEKMADGFQHNQED